MNKSKLKRHCMLPLFRVEVEKKVNPDKTSHRVYWEWVNASGKKNEAPPTFKNGTWNLFVDVVSKNNEVRSYPTTADANEDAWAKLKEAATASGYKDTISMVDKEKCTIDLQNGTLRILAQKIPTDDGWAPEVKLIYSDKDDLFKSSLKLSLDSAKHLSDIAAVFTNLAATFAEEK